MVERFRDVTYASASPRACPARARHDNAAVGSRSRAGSHIATFCKAIHDHKGEPGIRGILGVLSLAKKFGVSAVEDACSAALELRI